VFILSTDLPTSNKKWKNTTEEGMEFDPAILFFRCQRRDKRIQRRREKKLHEKDLKSESQLD